MKTTIANMASMALIAAGMMLINCYIGLVGLGAGATGILAFLAQMQTPFEATLNGFAAMTIQIFLNSLFPVMLIFAISAGPFLKILAISGTLIVIGVAGLLTLRDLEKKQ